MSHYFFVFIAIYPQQLYLFFLQIGYTEHFLNPSSGKTFCWCVFIPMCYPLSLKFIWSLHGKNLEGDNLGISIAFILFYLKIWSRLNINISLRKGFSCSLIRCEPYQTSITLNIIKFGSRDCICQAAIGILEGTVLFVLDRTLWVCLHQISLALA